MNPQAFGSVIAAFSGLIFLMTGVSVFRSAGRPSPAWWVYWIAAVGILSSLALAVNPLETPYLLFILAIASFLPLVQIVSRGPGKTWWWAAGGIVLVALYTLVPAPKPTIFLVSAFLVFFAISAILTSVWRNACQPQEYNQIYYLLISCIFLLAASLASVFLSAALGQMLIAASLWVTCKTLRSKSLTFIQGQMHQWIIYTLIAIPSALAAQVVYLFATPFDQLLPSWGPAVSGFALAGILIGLFKLLRRWAPGIANRIIPVSIYDSNRVMREFSMGISNITNPELLATISLGLISEAVELRRGHLFAVNTEITASGSAYQLTSMGGMGKIAPEAQTILLPAHQSFVRSLHKNRQVVFLCEFAASAEFKTLSAAEKNWFGLLDMQLFVPIHAKEEWIGLIALDTKASGASYNPQDLNLITTLADQLSLAIQNARLVDSLMRVNNEYRRAYTAMEQSNRQLQQAIFQLEKMDQTKSDFISVSSHELRTPLTVMRGYAEMLLDDAEMQQMGQFKMIKGIHSGIMRLNEVVESMLDVASIDARSLELNRQSISIYHVINSVCSGLKSVFAERKIKLTLENLRDLPAIEADAEMLTKVFYQLVTNAIKFTPDDGLLTISGVIVSPGQMGFVHGAVEIVIADTGIGIEPSNLELIFRKFFQTGKVALHSSGKTKFKGSGPGLGLAIAKGIIEAHSGKIWAESKGMDEQTLPGSQFHVVLPQSPDQQTTF